MIEIKTAGAVLGVGAGGVLAVLGWYDVAAACGLISIGFLVGLVRHE